MADCAADRPCADGLVCHPTLSRCTAEAPGPERIYVELRTDDDQIPVLHALSLGADDLAEPTVQVALPPLATIEGFLVDAGSGVSLPGSVAVSMLDSDAPVMPRVDVNTRAGRRASGDGGVAIGSSFEVRVAAGHTYGFEAVPDVAALPSSALTEAVTTGGRFRVSLAVAGVDGASRAAPVTLRLLRSDGAPISDAQVAIEAHHGPRVSGSAVTDASGRAQLLLGGGVDAGALDLIAWELAGASGAVARVAIPDGAIDATTGGDLGDVTLPLQPLESSSQLTVSLRCGAAAGAAEVGVGGAQVTAIRLGAGLDQRVAATTDSSGRADLALQPGSFFLAALPPPQLPIGLTTRVVTLAPGELGAVDLPCWPRGQIEGEVLDREGAPLADVHVQDLAPQPLPDVLRAEGVGAVPRGAATLTDALGGFRLLADAGGAGAPVVHRLVFEPPDPRLSPPFVRTVSMARAADGRAPLERLSVSLPTPFLRVFEIRDANGERVRSARVVVRWRDPEAPRGHLAVSALTNGEGRLTLNLPAAEP